MFQDQGVLPVAVIVVFLAHLFVDELVFEHEFNGIEFPAYYLDYSIIQTQETLEDFLVLYSDALGFSATQKQALQSGKMDIEFLDYDWRLNDSNVPAADAPTGSMSPIWLARSFPVPAAIIALVLLLLLYGAYQFFQRQQILSRKGADKSKVWS